jgi:hypothetical protein
MKTQLIGHVGVDSGQLLLCDPCYIDSQWEKEEYEGDDEAKHPFSYKSCAHATLSEDGHGQLNYKHGNKGVGVAFSTAFGDGMYPVVAHYMPDGTLRSVEVVFQNDDDEDDY